MKKYYPAIYYIATVLAALFCILKAAAVSKAPVNIPPSGAEVCISALAPVVLASPGALSAEDARKLLPLLEELAPLEERRQEVFRLITLALNDDQKQFIEDRLDTSKGLRGDPYKTAGFLLLPDGGKPPVQKMIERNIRPYWPHREPSTEELSGGILLLYRKELLTSRQKTVLSELLKEEGDLLQKINIKYDSNIDVLRAVIGPHLKDYRGDIPPEGSGYGRRHMGILLNLVKLRARRN